MTPYTKEIVELHKIHKAIEGKNGGDGGNTPSGNTTIDDIVKFIHDDFVSSGSSDYFPYTTFEEIPWHDDANDGDICKTTGSGRTFQSYILNIPNYIIGIKGQDKPPK